MRGIDTGRRPIVLVWEVTQACDLACDHCRADARRRRHPDELSTREGKRLLDRAAAFGDGQLVVLSGGDPCKRRDLLELVEYGIQQGLTITLTPSGTEQLTPDRVGALADAGLRRLALGLDGAGFASHDEFRGEDGSFVATMRAAEAARAADLPLQVNTTVCASTVDELPAIRDVVADLDAVLWSVFFLVPVGRGRELAPIGPERSDEVMDWLSEVAETADFGLETTEAPHYRRVVDQRNDGDAPTRRGGVIAGDGFAFVSHVGDIYPSGFLPEAAGDVRTDDLVDVYRNADLFERRRDRGELGGKCVACPFRAVCGGSRSRAYATTGDPLASDPLCPYVPPEYEGPVPGPAHT